MGELLYRLSERLSTQIALSWDSCYAGIRAVELCSMSNVMVGNFVWITVYCERPDDLPRCTCDRQHARTKPLLVFSCRNVLTGPVKCQKAFLH